VTLAYPDAISHLLISRRVVAASTPGAAQLGAVWLPLPHLLSLPFVWVSAWYYSGFAGSVISMAAYVATVRYAYRITAGLTGNRIGAVVAAVSFGANPNVLYLQSTPMTEMLLIACIAAAVDYLMRWSQTGHYAHLARGALATLLATLTRYEGWVLCAAVTMTVAYVAWQRHRTPVSHPGLDRFGGLRLVSRETASRRRWRRYHAVEANVIYFGYLGVSGILGWVLWNAVIFHSPLYFQTGQFAKPSLWVSHSEKAIGHLGVAAKTYLYAMADNAGFAALALAALGFLCYLIRTRLRAETVAPLALTVFIPFFVYALYSGQRPLHVMQVSGDLYNIRFGLLMTLPVAIFIGFLAAEIAGIGRVLLRRSGYTALIVAAIACVSLVAGGGIDTLKEAQVFRGSATERANAVAADWLRAHYDGGKVLMESFGNETVTFDSRLPVGQIIYEGSFRQWAPALAYPAGHGIRWIYMRQTPGSPDDVFTRLHGTVLLGSYHLVYRDADRLIYTYAPAQASPSPARQASHRRHRPAASG
jgi:hypothetical protein